VPLGEYLDAYIKLESNEPIDNPPMMAMPDKPQQMMTVGLVLELLAGFIVKPVNL